MTLVFYEMHVWTRTYQCRFWAISCGALKLAHLLWQRCKCPLRAALLAQQMCKQIGEKKPLQVRELQEAQERFIKAATGVLEHLDSQDVARKLLQTTRGPFGTLGIAYTCGPIPCHPLICLNTGVTYTFDHVPCLKAAAGRVRSA